MRFLRKNSLIFGHFVWLIVLNNIDNYDINYFSYLFYRYVTLMSKMVKLEVLRNKLEPQTFQMMQFDNRLKWLKTLVSQLLNKIDMTLEIMMWLFIVFNYFMWSMWCSCLGLDDLIKTMIIYDFIVQ